MNGYGTPIVYYLESSYDLETVKDMNENDAELDNYLPFTAAGSLEQQSFLNPDLNKMLQCDLVYIYGSSSLLCSASGELMADDLNGCILSSEAAWQLFGETSVIGGEITYNSRNFYVRGIYEDTAASVVLPAQSVFEEKEEDGMLENGMGGGMDEGLGGGFDIQPGGDTPENNGAAFDKIIIKPEDGSGSSARRTEYVQAFENRWGIGGNKTDCLIYQRLASFFMMLIPALILICVMIKGLRFVLRNRYKPFWLAAGLLGTAIMFAAFFVICQVSPSIPADLIPNTWSDFDFWGDTIDTMKNSIQHILFFNKSDIELSYFRPLMGIFGYLLAGIVLFVTAAFSFKPEDGRGFFIIIIGTCLTELIAIYIMRQSQMPVDSLQMLLYLWPYLLVGKFIFKRDKH